MSLWDSYARAAATAKRSVASLLREATRLRLSRLRLGLSEYIDFRLYEDDLSWADKQAFGGVRAQAILEELLIDDYSSILSLDKVTMYALLISGLRVHSFLSAQSTRVIKAIFKLNVGQRDSDNFEHGASGNMLGAVDIATGKVVRAISGVGLGQRVNPKHPVSGADIVGFTLPNWTDVTDFVREAQKAFPGFICPGWDIALCADGPKILEVNAFGDIDLSQHAYRRGFLDAGLLSLLRERGLKALLEGPAKRRARSPKNNRFGARKHHWRW